jgi:hypothetical protein
MRVGRSEAVDLFSKWGTGRTLLRVDFTFAAFAACFRGRVAGLSETELRLLSDDTFSEFVLRFKPDLEFEYGDPREFPEEAELYESALVVLFPLLSPDEEGDKISFTELKEEE